MARVTDTRERMLDVAERLFAEKGFAATSLRDIGGELGLANASLLYHFSNKRKIYGGVLERIADSLGGVADEFEATACEGSDVLLALADTFLAWGVAHSLYVRIIVRELLDNHERAPSAGRWHLSPAVDRMAKHIARSGHEGEPVLALMHVVGSVSYFLVGLPTISGMLGRKPNALTATFRRELRSYYR
jgi:AcrR family transcriptional regulator